MRAGDRLIAAAEEAASIARGEQPAARIHINGHSYVPESAYLELEKVAGATDALAAALDNIIPRFKRCMEHAGSDAEFSEIAVEPARAALAAYRALREKETTA